MRYNSSHTYRKLYFNSKACTTIDTANSNNFQTINFTGQI